MMRHIASPTALSNLTNIQKQDVQPNAVDLRLDKVFKMKNSKFVIDEEFKGHRGTEEVLPDDDGYWELEPGSYEIVMENIIHVGQGEAGFVITRSTLNRNGVYITSGLYDSGYHGIMAGVMHVTNGPMRVAKGTRVGQFLLFQSETIGSYDGDYGLNKKHDKKYGV